MKKIKKIISRSPEESKKIGQLLGKRLKAGDVVTLWGQLGAGKTTLVKGLVKGMGLSSDTTVASPTFVIIHEYPGKIPIYHLDWYRLPKVTGADEQLALECFEKEAVSLVEWPERGKQLLPQDRIEIHIAYGPKKAPSTRKIELRLIGKKYANFVF